MSLPWTRSRGSRGIGWLSGIADGSPPLGGLVEGLSPAPSGVDGFVLGWLGGARDTTTSISLEPDAAGGLALRWATGSPPGACILIGVPRCVLIRTSGPVDIHNIVLR